MREVNNIIFREIKILGVDNLDIKMIPGVDNMVMVPYILSEAPPDEWKHYFSSRAPKDADARIDGDRALYKCPKDKEIIKGECRNKVAKLVDDANLHCREISCSFWSRSSCSLACIRSCSALQRDFDEWKRNW